MSTVVTGARSPAASPTAVGAGVPASPKPYGEGGSRPEGTSGEWLDLPACPACRTVERTVVCEWNKLVLLDTAPDEDASRYDYAVCHGCGILYATRRPVGGRYRHLVDNFEDVIDKDARNPLLNPHPLTEGDRERYRRLIARGVFVSDHEPGNSLGSVLRDRMENAGHVDLPLWAPISQDDREQRICAYRRARDRAVLRAPERVWGRFASMWHSTIERAVASGVARFDDKGELRIVTKRPDDRTRRRAASDAACGAW